MKKTKEIKYYEVQKVDTIKQLLELAVEQAGDKIAFKYKDGKKVVDVTYKEFQNDTIALGTALNSINMADKHIAIIGENSYKWLNVYLTALKSKGVFIPIDKELPKEDIMNVLENSDADVLFYAKKYEKYIEEFMQKLKNVKYFIGLDLEKSQGNKLSYNEFLQLGKKMYNSGDNTYKNMVTDHNSLKMLVYTSGTTGMAKGVMLSEKNLISIVYYGLQVSTVYERCLSVLPYHHTYEAVAGILVSLHHHSTICINDSLKSVLKNLQLYKPDYIYLVPAFVEIFYKKILSNAAEKHKAKTLKILMKVSNILRKIGIDLRKKFFKSIHEAFGGNLRKIVTGGAAIRPELGKFFDAIGISLVNGYGITECSPLVCANMDNKLNDCSTVGFPLPCCEVQLEDVTPEGDGEICVKGDMVMLGYYKNPTKTEEVLKDGWFKTGDYGRINKKGQLIITGRKKNLIVLNNGKNVFPEEIENYIMRIQYVQEVIVYAIKENNVESGLCAEVYLNEEKLKEMNIVNKEENLKKDIAKQCENLPVYKHINKIVIRDKEFDKTTTNKIKR